ncbi:MAG: rhodanese-like domain-containing protein [Phycisphaeraceae bacterium]|nr:rhodanese-like domain-containing protein [Phycisphaeraceae bacterium]
MNVESISPERLAQKDRFELIDVRTPTEFKTRHAAPAQNVPFHKLEQWARQQDDRNQTVHLICEKGVRSEEAAKKLLESGFTNVAHVEGGTRAWEAAGLPVIRSVRTFSIERQVRVAAGILILIGVAGGWWVHPAFYGLSAFVGAGLLFAGLTDFCGMGMVLAAMPWNRVSAETKEPSATATPAHS